MKKLILFLHLILISTALVLDAAEHETQVHRILEKKLTDPQQSTKKSYNKKRFIKFHYENEPLVDIINYLAAEKSINIVLPSGNDTIKSTITLNIEQSLTLEEAWDILYTLLDVAGYTMVTQPDLYMIVKNNKEIYREPLPVYINTALEKLPESDERIRYISYLSNIEVSNEGNSTLKVLLNTLLADTARYQIDEGNNALIISDKSINIRSIMHAILSIDQTSFQEKLEIVKLRYVDAATITRLFNEQILDSAQRTQRYQLHKDKPQQASYFPENIKIIDVPRTNSLILLGKIEAVERVKDFIFKYIDVELESGRSILHVYRLQYLDAEDLAITLNKIVKSARGDQAAQQAQSGQTVAGVRRFFDQVIITTDKPEKSETGSYLGSNALLIAARKDDWVQLKRLIEELDIPQSQVIIEVLIADLTLDDIRSLGSIFRNPAVIPLEGNVDFQSAQAGPVILNSDQLGTVHNPTTIKSDLLGEVFTNAAGTPVSVASSFAAGSTVFSFNDKDGKTWGIASLLKTLSSRKVLSHPHVVAINNQAAEITVGEKRLLPGPGSGSTGGTTTALKVLITANLTIKITPRISSGDSVNLKIEVKIEEFESTTDITNGNRLSRIVETNAEVGNKAILSLGGLSRVDTEQDRNSTPLLSQIPIIGWLFKQRNSTINKTNLTVFISPTIIQPRLRGGAGAYTRDYISVATQYSKEGALFESLKDPITRWFFTPTSEDATVALESFVAKDEALIAQELRAERKAMKSRQKLATLTEQQSSTSPIQTNADIENQPAPLLKEKKRTNVIIPVKKPEPVVQPNDNASLGNNADNKKEHNRELIDLMQNIDNPLNEAHNGFLSR